ncbi:MAG: 4Fe-4S binding protein [Leptospirales bacterium]
MNLRKDHPTVRKFRNLTKGPPSPEGPLSSEWLRTLALESGADDVGFVPVDSSEIENQKSEILGVFPKAQSVISFVCRMNRENLRNPARSIANLEFHQSVHHTDDVARRIVSALERRGVLAVNPSTGFQMEADQWGTGRIWIVSHKPIAVAAGLGKKGIHRNVIHPKFGNFILLGSVLVSARIDRYSVPLDYNPCLSCKLCVSACPTGAISSDGRFDFSACYTHNYREFMGGFGDWVDTIANSRNAQDYGTRVTRPETVSMWQSLSFGANYKAAYCIAVCPAGEDVIGPYLTHRQEFLDEIVKPLRDKSETVYVVTGSDAEEHVSRHFPRKSIKRVSNGLFAQTTISAFLRGLPLLFQRGRAKGIDITYHWTFTGDEEHLATVVIRNHFLEVLDGHVGRADLRIMADSRTWLRILRKEIGVVVPLLTRKVRIQGSPRHLHAFIRCFPS